MKSKSMAKWLKFILFGAAACGLAVYLWIIPEMGKTIAAWDNGAFAPFYWPWLIFLWATGVPCFAALVLAWKIAGNIGADRPFSLANAGLLKGIARLAAGDEMCIRDRRRDPPPPGPPALCPAQRRIRPLFSLSCGKQRRRSRCGTGSRSPGLR